MQLGRAARGRRGRPGRPVRLPRRLDDLRSPRATLLRWVRTGPGGAAALTRPARGLDRLPADRVALGRDVVVGDHVDVYLGPAGRLEVGDGVVLGDHVQLAVDARVAIGAGSRLGAHVVVTDTWTYGATPTVPAPPPAPVEVGADVVLGARTVLGPGVRLPPGTVLAPGSHRFAAPAAAP